MTPWYMVALMIQLTGPIGHWLLHWPARREYLWQSMGIGMAMCLNIIGRHEWGALFDAVLLAVFLYLWWHSGGGDDFKRRLKKFARMFKPVRRSAPVTT